MIDASYRIPYFTLDGEVDAAFYRIRRLMLPGASDEAVAEAEDPAQSKFRLLATTQFDIAIVYAAVVERFMGRDSG